MKGFKALSSLAAALLAVATLGCTKQEAPKAETAVQQVASEAKGAAEGAAKELEAREIATEAYIYAYPLVTMEVTRRQMTNLAPGVKLGFGPMGALSHARMYPPAGFRAVVRPNFDTLYSVAWFDLTEEPMILSVHMSYSGSR